MSRKKANKQEDIRENNISRKKKIIIGSLILIVLVLTFGIKLIFDKNSEKENNELVLINESNYIGKIDEGIYYMANANPKISFEVKEKKNSSYIIKDSNGNEVKTTKIKEIDNHYYIINEKSYQAGEEYTLEIFNNELKHEKLKNAKKVIFKIEKAEIEKYVFSENVIEKNYKDLKINKNKLNISNLDIKANDIILVKNNNNYTDAYKIKSINGNEATFDVAELNEIYKELELYKKFQPDFNKMTLYNEDGGIVAMNQIDDYLTETVENKVVKEMPVYQFLANEAKKTGNEIENGIEFKKEAGKLKFEINVTVKANGKEFMGIEALKEHDLNMNFSFEIALDFLVDILKGKNINIAVTATETLDLEISLKSSIYHEGFSGLDDSEYDKTISDIAKRIEGGKSDSASGRATIGALEIPTQIPGLNVYFDLYFQTDTKLVLNASYKQTISESQTIGLATISGELKPYFIETEPTVNFNFDIFGSANAKLGVGLDIGLSVINKNIANVNIGEEIGFYADLFATANVNYDSKESKDIINTYAGGKIELGIYAEAKMNSNINFLFLHQAKSVDFINAKKPLFQIGSDDITTGIEPAEKEIDLRKSKSVTIPITYKKVLNVPTGEVTKEAIKVNKLKYINAAGEDLTKTKINFNGKNEFVITISYEEQGKTYKTSVKLIKDDTTNLADVTIDMNPPEEPADSNENPNSENKKPQEQKPEEQKPQEENPEEPEEEPKMIQVSKEEAMEYCRKNFEKEINGVTLSCQYSNEVRIGKALDNRKMHAIYVLASDDPWTHGISDFTTKPCKYGHFYTTLFVPTEYEEDGFYMQTGWWFEDYAEVDYISTVTFPFIMN